MKTTAKNQNALLNIFLGTSCFLLMFQLYCIAPLLPAYTGEFNSSLLNMAIPAFAIPFATAAACMVLSPSTFKKPEWWIALSLLAMSSGSLLLSTVGSAEVFLLNRMLTGVGTGTMLPSALVLATRSADKKESFSNMIRIILSLATGMTFAPSIGGWLNESLGWRSLFQVVGMISALLWLLFIMFNIRNKSISYRQIRMVERESNLHIIWKGRKIYSFVFLSGVFHSGVFVWISYYFTLQYKLGAYDLGTALFIFGLPGLTVAILLFRMNQDTSGVRILYSGLALTILGLLVMMQHLPLWLAECLLALMSLGFSLSQPLFIGILKLPKAGLSAGTLFAIGSGILFAGYGSGPLIMAALLESQKYAGIGFLVFVVIVMAGLGSYVTSGTHPG